MLGLVGLSLPRCLPVRGQVPYDAALKNYTSWLPALLPASPGLTTIQGNAIHTQLPYYYQH